MATPLCRNTLGLSMLLVACTTRPEIARRHTETRLAVVPRSADVWAWSIAVRPSAREPLEGCTVVHDGRRQRVRVSGPTTLLLAPGRNRVRMECDTADGERLRSPNVVYVARLRDAPSAHIDLETTRGRVRLDARKSRPNARTKAPIVGYRWTVSNAHGRRVLGQNPVLDVPADSTDAQYEVVVRDARGRTDEARVRMTLRGNTPDEARPSWHARAVVYGVIPPLYGDPPLKAVTRALPDLHDLGVDVLWLSPVYRTTPDDFGYAVADYFRVREDFGTTGDLVALVRAAHALGMRVILDFVPNHTAAAHPYFQDARRYGRESHYHGFYERDGQGRTQHYFDWRHLPNLHYAEPEVRAFMLDAFEHWIRRAGIDGYRVDVAWGIRNRRPSFWPSWAQAMRRLRPDAFLIAEASARDPFYVRNGFDAAYDWTEELGHWAWRDVFDDPKQIAKRLDAALEETWRVSGDRVMHFLNNNDTGARFVTRHGPQLTRVAAAALLTLPGTPCLYAGDEHGAEYEPYEIVTPMPRADLHGLRPWYKRLIRMRHDEPALYGGTFERAVLGTHVYGYFRAVPARRVLVLLNFGAKAEEVRLASARAWRDLLDDAAHVRPVRGVIRVDVAPFGVRVLRESAAELLAE